VRSVPAGVLTTAASCAPHRQRRYDRAKPP